MDQQFYDASMTQRWQISKTNQHDNKFWISRRKQYGLDRLPEESSDKIENIPCDKVLADFADLAELRKTKGYKVVISDRMSFIEKIKAEDQAIENLCNDLKEKA